MEEKLNKFLNYAIFKKFLCVCLENLLFLISFAISLFVILNFLNKILLNLLPFWIFCFASILLTAYSIFKTVSLLLEKKEKIIIELQRKNTYLKDDLINAWQIKNQLISGKIKEMGLSEEISKKFINLTLENLSLAIIDSTFDLKKPLSKYGGLFLVSILSLVFFLHLPYYFPLDLLNPSLKIERFIKILPKNFNVPHGESVTISAIPFSELFYEPILKLRFGEEKYRKIKMEKREKIFIYKIDNVTENIYYQILLGGLRSKKFIINPLTKPIIKDISISVYFPSYTKLPKKEIKDFNEINYLPGTYIEFKAISNKELKDAHIVFESLQRQKLKIKKDTVEGKFSISKTCYCYFELVAIDGTKTADPVKYLINVIDDKPPTVEILSPNYDLTISKYDKVPIIYRIEDDYGFSKVQITFKTLYSGEKILTLETPNENKFIGQYEFDPIRFKENEIITYYVSSFDNDIVSGPKETRSRPYQIEIFSYEKQKEEIIEELKSLDSEIIKNLGKQVSLKDEIYKTLQTTQTISPDKFITQQKEISQLNEKVIEKLQKIIEQMERNPYFDYLFLQGQKNNLTDLKYLNDLSFPQAVDALKEENYTTAMDVQNEIIKIFERVSTQNEQLLKYQNMTDLLTAADKSYELAQELTSTLNKEKITKEDLEKINKIFDEINKMFNEIQNLLERMPTQLPEDFINQSTIKGINLQNISNLMDSINKAISTGNYKSALEHAKQLLTHLRSLYENLQNASASMGLSSELDKTEKKLNEKMEKLKEIILSQSQLLSKTNEIELRRQELLLRQQEEILKELAKKQKEIIEYTKKHVASFKVDKEYISQLHKTMMSKTLDKMESVYKELSEPMIKDSPKLLEEIINSCQIIKQQITREYKIDLGLFVTELTYIETEERKILEILKQEIAVEFSPREKTKLKNISQEQQNLKTETTDLAKSMKQILDETLLSQTQPLLNLYNAAREMSTAVFNLNNEKTNKAIENQQNALDYLLQTQENLSSTIQALQMAKKTAGKQISPSVHGKDGFYGVRVGIVKLPEKDKFIPSKELKIEIIKSLKERYPKTYEEIIKKYFKDIIE